MVVLYAIKFEKQYRKAPQSVQKSFDKKLVMFLQDRKMPMLREHKLSGKYRGLKSINVTGDWRALFSERQYKDKQVIRFETLGTHSQLYE